MVVGYMQSDNRWKERGEELQNSSYTRRTPSEWWLLEYLIYKLIEKMAALIGKKRKNREKESKLDDSGTC
jgi:hypothetical protein